MKIFIALLVTLFITPSALASPPNDQWQFELSPLFFWGANIDGSATAGPVTVPLDLTFNDDIAENLQGVFTVHFEAKKGRLLLFSEYQYVDLELSAALPDGSVADITFKNTLVEIGAGYLVAKTENFDWEVLGGIRYNKQDLIVDNLPEPIPSIKGGDTWGDVFAGGRVIYNIAQDWKLMTRADIATGGSQRVWNVVAMIDYRFNDWGSVFAGYKAMDYKFDNHNSGTDEYAVDYRMDGLLMGLNIHW